MSQNSVSWADPTFWEVWRRRQRARVPTLLIVHHVGPRYWGHAGWTDDIQEATQFADVDTAWLIAECCQDGEVTVEHLHSLLVRRDNTE